MPDTELASLTEDTAPATTDWWYKVDSAGTADRKVAGPNLGYAMIAAWTSYTPTWTAVTTNPTIGNGTLEGAFCRIGKLVIFRVTLLFGSTTTAGSGIYEWALPVAPAATYTAGSNAGGFLCTGYGEDAGVLGVSVDSGRIKTGSKCWLNVSNNASASSGAAQQVAHNVPFSWGDGDNLMFSGMYEAA